MENKVHIGWATPLVNTEVIWAIRACGEVAVMCFICVLPW